MIYHPIAYITHAKRYGEDLDLVINELTQKSRVIDYIPGRFHRSFKDIKPHISDHVDLDSLFKWIKKHQNKIETQMKLKTVLYPKKVQKLKDTKLLLLFSTVQSVT